MRATVFMMTLRSPPLLLARWEQEMKESWDGAHLVDTTCLWLFRCGPPYEDESSSNDVYYVRMRRDADLEKQIAMLVPPPEALSWKKLGTIEMNRPRTFAVFTFDTLNHIVDELCALLCD
jgi:hypothetical protein